MLVYECCCSEFAFATSFSSEKKKKKWNIALSSMFEKRYLSVSKISTSFPKVPVYAQHA